MPDFPDQYIDHLREAVRISPDNVPLRLALGDALMANRDYRHAESVYRDALALEMNNTKIKVSLATAFYEQGKDSQAIVIIEDVLKSSDAPPPALLLHARLLLRSNHDARASCQYRRAVELDPKLVDPELSARWSLDTSSINSLEIVGGSALAGMLPSHRHRFRGRRKKGENKSAIRFSDVGGMESVKEEIRMKIINPIIHADLYKTYGKTAGGGILLFGPPGCGKTHLARANAGEINANFFSIGITDVLDMWIGSSEKKLAAIFENARQSQPCVLFFDEVDALAAARSDMRASAGRHTINQFLSELDGVGKDNEGILVMAASNAPWHVDPAFRRPGRFDRVLFVPPPDFPARAAILHIHLKDRPVSELDYNTVASQTDGYSGADLKGVVDIAVETKIRDAMRTGTPTPITTADLVNALQQAKPTTAEWFSTARNYALYANQAGTYNDILKYFQP
jgi:ATP-dependent 26S proteasome regulatory subunit